ncbi:MAG: hypothetical protein IJ558_00830 [Treponema sp.]|nr:hypothetical protein [Treponema sp.]
MIIVFIAAFFCVLNITLWIFFLAKFKKIFSTDDIIASTRSEMENMIVDINRNAGRNIEIIEDRIKQLRAVVAEADRHLDVAKRELDKQRANLSYQQKIDSALLSKKAPAQYTPQSRAVEQYLRNAPLPSNISSGLQSGVTYELTDEGNRHVSSQQTPLEQNMQSAPQNGELFRPEDYDNYQIVSKSGTRFTVENDGSSYASVPVIGQNVTYADNPIQPKKKFRDLVRDLHLVGHSVEEIALELNSSTTEVQMVLDMI